MENKIFNEKIKKIFNKFSQAEDMVNAITIMWFNYEFTDEQTNQLDVLKSDIQRDLASCAERYYLKGENQ